MRSCYIFDIDGTIADPSHRLHYILNDPKDWDAFFEACDQDAPIYHMISLCEKLSTYNDIVYVSGRSNTTMKKTWEWLARHGLPLDPVYMREAGDHRPDNLVKLDLLDELRADGFDPIMAFDDRNQVVDMWRENGIPCLQVAPGDF